jgi:hypothetical protein
MNLIMTDSACFPPALARFIKFPCELCKGVVGGGRAHLWVQALVVEQSLLLVGKNVVGLLDFCEPDLGGLGGI